MKWLIKVETKAGEIIEAFVFSGTSENGVSRAKDEAHKFGMTPKRVWAEPISSN